MYRGWGWYRRIGGKKAKYLFYEIDLRSTTGQEELLSVSHITGVTPRSIKNVTMFKSESYEGSKLCNPDDLVVNTMWAWMAALGVSKYKGIVSPSYHVYRLKHEDSLAPEYIDKLLRSWGYAVEYRIRSTGIRPSRLRLYPDKFLAIPICIPSLKEQKQIIKYIKFKSSQIARFIRAKKRMIELLKEQKQAIINDAVTGNINVRTGKPYPKYKPSGVEWLGDVPVGWKTMPVKRIASFNPSKTETGFNSQSDECVVFLPMENVSTAGVINCSIRKPYHEICNGFSYFRKGDVVVAKITPCFENGKGAFLETLETEYGFGTTEFITIRPGNKVNGKYLRLLLSSNWFLKIAVKYMTGSAGQKRISTDFIKNFYLVLPVADVQDKIVECIQQEFRVLDLVISRTEREINLMQEYRTRLIADVVTGKVDVRDIRVPEFAEERLIIEDITETEEISACADISTGSAEENDDVEKICNE